MSVVTQTFTSTGTFTAPAGLQGSSVSVTVVGGSDSGTYAYTTTPGAGRGAVVTGNISISPGGQLLCTVATSGTPFGFHEGGSSVYGDVGSGSSAVQLVGSPDTLLIEAGGSGGGGYGGLPGAGGTPNAGNGGGYGSGSYGPGGFGATAGAAGAGGGDGSAGSGGSGGAGGSGTHSGGGGGGGTYGGGGGGGASGYGGGGGGGASYAASSVAGATFTTDTALAGPMVQIAYATADAPYSPTLLAPANGGYADIANAGATFTWLYNPGTLTGAQNAYALRIKSVTGGSYSYFNAALGTLVGSIVWNASSAQSVVMPGALEANGVAYNWSIATQESLVGLQGPFATDSTFTGQVAPTPVLTAPPATVTAVPFTVSWTETLGGGFTQLSYRVVIYNQSDTLLSTFNPGSTVGVYDTGAVSSTALSASVSTVLSNGSVYVVYLQIVETGPESSQWVSTPFTLSIPGPPTPTLVATTGIDPVYSLPAGILSVVGSPGTFSGLTAEIQYSDDGVTWADCRYTAALVMVSGSVTGYDYEMVPQAPRYYRARQVAIVGIETVPSSWSVTQTATLTTTGAWLIDPIDLTQSIPFEMVAFTETQGVQNSPHYGLNVSLPAIVATVVNGKDGTFTALTTSLATWQALYAAITSQRTKWLINPMGDSAYISIGPMPGATSTTGGTPGKVRDTTLTPTSNPSVGVRSHSVQFVEVAKP